MKRLLAILLIAVAGCTRFENLEPESRLAVKDIAVTKSETAALTRARYDEATRELFWTDGDGYFFYTYGDGPALSTVTAGSLTTASSKTEIIPVTYNLANDNTVVIGSVGTDVGTVTSVAKTSVTIAGGIPAVQDGTVESSYVNLGTANLQSEDEAALRSCQAYLSFNLLNLNVGGRDTRFFTVEGRVNETICGNTTYTLSSGTGVPEGDGKKIVVNVTAAAQTDYYVAIAPRTYEEGLRVTLYDAGTVNSSTGEITGGHVNAYIDTYAGVSVSAGKILALGDLTSHKTVPGTGLAVHPSDAHIVKLSDFVQTKKLWIECTPADMTDIEFEYSQDGIIVAERGPDEYYNGKNYMTVIVTPVCDDIADAAEEYVCTLTVKDRYPAPGTAPASATCAVTVGMFIDLGLPSGTLWAATYVKETGTTPALALTTSVAETGSYFPWSWTQSRPQNDNLKLIWRWNDWNTFFPDADKHTFTAPAHGDKKDYNTNNVVVQMDTGFYKSRDVVPEQYDVCHCCHSSMNLPDSSQISELVDNTDGLSSFNYGGNLFWKLTSNIKFYDDVYILLRNGGSQTLPGKVFGLNGVCGFWSKKLNEHPSTDDLTDYGFNPGSGRNRFDWYCTYATTSIKISAGIFKDDKLDEALIWEGYPAKPVKSKTPPTP